MNNLKSYSAGRFAFSIDGDFVAFVRKCSGGAIKGEMVTSKLGPTNYERKHVSNLQYDPVTVEISMGMGRQMWDWIHSSWQRDFKQKHCSVATCNFNHEIMAVRWLRDAYIKKVTVPAMDGSSKDAGYFTVELEPTSIHYAPGFGKVMGREDVNSKKWLCSNFELDILGLPCRRVAKIDSFSWEQKVTTDEMGDSRMSQKEPTALSLSNLKLTISMADYWPWYAWLEASVVNGYAGLLSEKTGSLTFLANDMSEELGRIVFDRMGIISIEQESAEANSESVARFTVELYCESMVWKAYKAS